MLWLSIVACVGAGFGQARLLGCSVSRHAPSLAAFGRILLVVTALVLAAISGHLLVGTLAWLASFALASVFEYRRLA